MITEQEITSAIVETLQPLPFVNAVWLGGSAAWKRNDAYSDIDLMIDAEDDKVDDTMRIVTELLDSRFGIEVKYDINPQPMPGLTQAFFRLKNASRFLLIDCCILKHSAEGKLLEKEIHGEPQILFDKKGIVKAISINEAEHINKLHAKLPMMKTRFDLFQVFIEKELLRESYLDAYAYYLGFTLSPLVELLRIKYAPSFSGFGIRYLYIHLPKEIAEQVQALYFIKDGNDLKTKWQQAIEMFEKYY